MDLSPRVAGVLRIRKPGLVGEVRHANLCNAIRRRLGKHAAVPGLYRQCEPEQSLSRRFRRRAFWRRGRYVPFASGPTAGKLAAERGPAVPEHGGAGGRTDAPQRNAGGPAEQCPPPRAVAGPASGRCQPTAEGIGGQLEPLPESRTAAANSPLVAGRRQPTKASPAGRRAARRATPGGGTGRAAA